jgi:hypothetical protein
LIYTAKQASVEQNIVALIIQSVKLLPSVTLKLAFAPTASKATNVVMTGLAKLTLLVPKMSATSKQKILTALQIICTVF